MAKIITYANNERQCFCNIQLDSGERVMISIAAAPTPSTKLFQMAFLGLFPRKVIWELNPQMAGGYDGYIRRLMEIFASEPPAMTHPLDAIRDFVVPQPSIAALTVALLKRERDSRGRFERQVPTPSPSDAQLTDDEAQTIVYAFIDLVAAGNPYIGDASTLPFPKHIIRQAFHKHLQHYYALRRISEDTFRELGYDKTVEQLSAMSVYLDDWHDLDPEDRDAIARLNAVTGPPPEWAAPLLAKYFKRAVQPRSAV